MTTTNIITFTSPTHEDRFYEYMERANFDYSDTYAKAFIYLISCDLLANKLDYIYDLENNRSIYDEAKIAVFSSAERQLIKVAGDLYGLGATEIPTLGALLSNLDKINVEVLRGVLDIFINRNTPLADSFIENARRRGQERIKEQEQLIEIYDSLLK